MTDAAGAGGSASRPGLEKGPAAFRTISETALEVGVPAHVLRFWETRFAFIRPTKRAGGRRFYRPQDVELLRGVRRLLQDDGYTIRGVQKLHREQGLKRLLALRDGAPGSPPAVVEAPPPQPAPVDEVDAGAPDLPAAEPRGGDPVMGPEPDSAEPPVERDRALRPVLDAPARARLADILRELESTKAEIDTLLGDP